MELCLGTVQFGMDYGIQGGKKPSKAEIIKTLDYARENKITMLDTATGYGDAQTVIGKYMINHPGSFDIISKLSKDLFKNLSPRECILAAYQDAEATLQQLWIPSLKGILFHNPNHLYDKNAVSALKQLKQAGYTEWIGVSVYEPKDAEYAMELGMDLIQLPANLFDHRFDAVIKKAGASVKLFARSVYLQGLLLMDSDEVKVKFPAAEEYILKLDQLCNNFGYSRRDIALAYIKKKSGVSAIVFGVDNSDQLKENIAAYKTEVAPEVIDEITDYFNKVSEFIFSPLKWNTKDLCILPTPKNTGRAY